MENHKDLKITFNYRAMNHNMYFLFFPSHPFSLISSLSFFYSSHPLEQQTIELCDVWNIDCF